MNMTERDIARKMGKVAGDCRLGDDVHKEVNGLTEYRLMDEVLRNTVDSFNGAVMVISTMTEEAIDRFDNNPHRAEEI